MRIIMPAMPIIAIVAILAHSASQQFILQQRATSYVSAHPWCQAYWASIRHEREAHMTRMTHHRPRLMEQPE